MEVTVYLWNCHYERSEESAVVCAWNDDGAEQQIPHGLKAVRDDNSEMAKPDITYAIRDKMPARVSLLRLLLRDQHDVVIRPTAGDSQFLVLPIVIESVNEQVVEIGNQ